LLTQIVDDVLIARNAGRWKLATRLPFSVLGGSAPPTQNLRN
jgi:hypothetical protein